MKTTASAPWLFALCAMGFLTNGDIYSGAPLLISIANDLHVGISNAALSITSYMIAFGLFNIVLGPLGDRFGRSRIIMVSSFGTALFSCACALADTLPQLIACRALNGAFAAGIMPMAVAIIGDACPESQRQRSISTLVGVMLLGGASATALGGALAHWFSWRTVYLAYGLAELCVSCLLAATLENRPGTLARRGMGGIYKEALGNGGVVGCLFLVALSGFVVFGSFSYTGELVRRATGSDLFAVGGILSFFGLGGMVSSRCSGVIKEIALSRLCLWTGLGGGLAMGLLSLAGSAPVFCVLLLVWGFSFVSLHTSYVTVAQNLIPGLRGSVMALMSLGMLSGGALGTMINRTILTTAGIDRIFMVSSPLFACIGLFTWIVLTYARQSQGTPKNDARSTAVS
ncbi:MAG: MFS transporter [Desulfobacteraceae bacterium]|nr:MFS transporter [Desulfobacteraceae bacterium]